MRIAIIYGVCVKHDAISNAIAAEYRYLSERFGPDGVKFFGYQLEYPGWNHSIVQDSTQILGDSYFTSADLIIYHFGIYYELFNIILTGNGKAKQLACYHNVTPWKLLGSNYRGVIENSMRQQNNLFFADHVYCDSPYNRDCLRDFGMPDEKLSVMGLPIDVPGGQIRGKTSSETVRLLFIGRFVQSKGVLELLEALRQCLATGRGNYSLTVVGNRRFSDETYIGQMDAFLAANTELAKRVEYLGEVDETSKWNLLGNSDAFVLPTYHEGFCVPIVEALAAGCYVIGYDNTNVPNVVGELGALVTTGDVAALGRTLSGLCDEWAKSAGEGREPVLRNQHGSWTHQEFVRDANAWAAQFSGANHRRKFMGLVDRFLPVSGRHH